MRTRVKFCGMTRGVDIEAAETLGADYLGFVFVPSSPRSVDVELARGLRQATRTAKVVGVFADHSVEQIERHCEALRIDIVQLHGTPDIAKVRRIQASVMQAFRGVPSEKTLELFLHHCPYVLIDKAHDAATVDCAAIGALPADIRSRLFVAGNITPSTVRDVIGQTAPFAVDCARGIESAPGIKDHLFMQTFFHNLP